MHPRVISSTWRRMDALTLESGNVRVTTIPNMGAKIVSLVDLRSGDEWLIDAGERPFWPAPYGAAYHAYDLSGWDEMFPTIVACAYPGKGAYQGVALPDHGEVWSLPWSVQSTEAGCITLSVEGPGLPYRLTRALDATAPATVRLHYTLDNLDEDPMPYLWAAHPQFVCPAGGQVIFPAQVTQVINTLPETWGWGAPETVFDWPGGRPLDGTPGQVDQVGAPSLKRGRKLFALPEAAANWAAVLRSSTGQWVRLEWDAQEIPYLGLWVDEGALVHASTAAPEPMTGWYDSLATAWSKRQVKIIPPRATHTWTLTVHLGVDGNPRPD